MNEKLKVQLLGGFALVIVLVIVIPLFFEDKSRTADSGKPVGEVSLPPVAGLPKPVPDGKSPVPLEKTSPTEQEQPSLQGDGVNKPKHGYTVIPLNEPDPGEAHLAPGGQRKTGRQNDFPGEEPGTEHGLAGQVSAPEKKNLPAQGHDLASEPVRPPASFVQPVPPRQTEGNPVTQERRKPLPEESRHRPFPGSTGSAAASAHESGRPVSVPESPARKNAAKPVGNEPVWRVQAGSFASEANARNLAEKLRSRNLPVQVTVTSGSLGPIYRVVVGQRLSRSKAEEIQRQIDTQDNVKGMILHGH